MATLNFQWGCAKVHFGASALIAVALLMLACAREPLTLTQPAPPSELEVLYKSAGQDMHNERDADRRWADGSHWLDGVSHDYPALPLEQGAYLSESMTCIQAEALLIASFPHEIADIKTWHQQPNADGIGRKWESDYANVVWGNHPKAWDWYKREAFIDWCGSYMESGQ